MQKMEGLLKEVEAPLVETNEVISEQSLDAEKKGLEADLQRAMKENQQGETESATLRAELLHLQEELKVERSRCKNMGKTSGWRDSGVSGHLQSLHQLGFISILKCNIRCYSNEGGTEIAMECQQRQEARTPLAPL